MATEIQSMSPSIWNRFSERTLLRLNDNMRMDVFFFTQSKRAICASAFGGVGGFTDPEIDSIDAGKTSPTEEAKEQRHSQPF